MRIPAVSSAPPAAVYQGLGPDGKLEAGGGREIGLVGRRDQDDDMDRGMTRWAIRVLVAWARRFRGSRRQVPTVEK